MAKTKIGKATAKQAKKEQAKSTHYGGAAQGSLIARDKSEIRGAQKSEANAIDEMWQERGDFQRATNELYDRNNDERLQYGRQNASTVEAADAMREGQRVRSDAYGLGADNAYGAFGAGRDARLSGAQRLESNPWMTDYSAGRGAILGGATALDAAGQNSAASIEQAGGRSAGMLEGYAQGAAAEYQSSADAAFKAAQNRNQRNALAIAAGRGTSAVRQALAGATSANAQAGLDQQVVRAQEANQLNAMRNDAIAQAAGIRGNALTTGAGVRSEALQGAANIRSGVAGMDQAAAAQQAANTAAAAQIRGDLGGQDLAAAQQQQQRQQFATGAQADLLGQRAAVQGANAQQQAAYLGQMSNLENANASLGQQTLGYEADAARSQRDAFLGAQQTQYTSQLGVDQQTELQRAEARKNNSRAEKFKRGVGVATLGILGS